MVGGRGPLTHVSGTAGLVLPLSLILTRVSGTAGLVLPFSLITVTPCLAPLAYIPKVTLYGVPGSKATTLLAIERVTVVIRVC